jgi:phytoene dehydrogenase-like protein
MKSDVVIIGGGVAGLAAGALLAHAGNDVTLLERGNALGGRAYCYEDRGYTLNYGAHAMYTPYSGVLAELMGRLGRPVPVCGFPRASRSYWALGERFASIGDQPHQVLTTQLFSLGGRINAAKMMLAIRSEKSDRLPETMTWGEWVRSQTGDRALYDFMMAFATVNTYTKPAEDLSAAWLIAQLRRTLFAKDFVGYMHGGWRSMYGAWSDEIVARGGRIITGARVERLEVRDGAIAAAVTDGERYEAGAFVCTLAPQDAPSIAGAGTALHEELSAYAAIEDVRAYTIDLGLSHALRGDDATFVFDVERKLYFSIHSASAPDLAPRGGDLLHAMAYLSPGEARDVGATDRRRDELIAGLDTHFPGWREAAVVERRLPNTRVAGARQTPANRARRVPVCSRAARNLYFANDARDIELNLAQISLAAAMEVADAVARRGVGRDAIAVAG